MEPLIVGYQRFKSIRSVGKVYSFASSPGYTLYLGANGVVLVCEVLSDEDLLDFASWMAECEVVETGSEGLAMALCAPIGPLQWTRTADGAIIVRQEPGTIATDPKFRCGNFTVPSAAGRHLFDLPVPVGALMQYLTAQVKGVKLGDRLEVVFRSNGTVPQFGPAGTELQTFGEIHPPMYVDGNGWSPPRREPQEIGSAKAIPAGVKVSVAYTSIDAAGRDLIVDVCCHE